MTENYLKKELYDLIKSESYLFDFIQSGFLDGIWYWDLENMEQEWMSPKFWKTLGYNPLEMKHLSSEWQDIIFPEDLEKALNNFRKHCDNPSHPYDQIVRYRHKDGYTVWIRCRGLAIRDNDGKAIRMLGAHTDITKLKKAEEDIKALKNDYEKVFNGTQDAMFLIKIIDKNEFRFIRNNRSHQIKTKITYEQIFNKTPQQLLGKEMGDMVTRNYKKCVEKGQPITYEEELNLPGGCSIWLTTLTPILEGDNKYIVGSSLDITERKKLELELEKSANLDKLTNLPNRRLFFKRLSQLIDERENSGNQFAILFIDLDGFKLINDNYGHEVGDQVLITVANRLLECVGESDTVARMGGDEFTIIINAVVERNVLERLVEKILNALQQIMYIDIYQCTVDASIGIVIYPDNGKNSDTLVRHADTAMYSVKKNGKSGYEFFDSIF